MLTGGNSISLHPGSSIENLGSGGLTLNSGGTISLDGDISIPGGMLTLNNGGLASSLGYIGVAGTVKLLGNGNVGTSAQPLNVGVGTLTDDKSGGNAYVYLNENGTVNLDGTTTGAGLLNVRRPGPTSP